MRLKSLFDDTEKSCDYIPTLSECPTTSEGLNVNILFIVY